MGFLLPISIGNHLVHVHVGLRAAARLPNAQWKMLIQLAGNHFVRRLRDQLRLFRGKFSEVLIHQRRGFFQNAKSANHLRRHRVLANSEVNQRARGLRAIVAVGGNVDRAHRIGFGASGTGDLHVRGSFGGFGHGATP